MIEINELRTKLCYSNSVAKIDLSGLWNHFRFCIGNTWHHGLQIATV